MRLKSEISNLGNYLDSNKDTKFDSQEKIDSFNQRVEQYNGLIYEYKTEYSIYDEMNSGYNTLLMSYSANSDTYKADCANKKYYKEDLIVAKPDSVINSIRVVGSHQ